MTSINNFIVTPKTLSKPLQTETPPLEDNSVTVTSTPENAQTPSVPADIMTLEDYYAACNAYNINDSDSNSDLLEVQENPYIIEVNYDLIKEKAAELGLKLAKGYYSLELPEKHSYLIYMDKDEINTYVWDVYNQEFVLYDKTDEKTKAHLEMIVAANVKHLSPTSYYGIFISEDMSSHYDFSRTIYRWNPETQGFDMLNNTELNELNLYNLWEHIDNVRLWQLRGCDPQTGELLESEMPDTPSLQTPAESTEEVIDIDDSSNDYFAQMDKVAEENGYVKTDTPGKYIYTDASGSNFVCIWDLTNNKFLLFRTNSSEPSENDLDENDMAVEQNVETLYAEATIKAYKEGYKPTDRFGIYEKDGLFYEYDIDKKEFIPFDNEEPFEAKVDEGARPIKRTLANIYLAANMLAMIYGYTPTATLGVYKDADNNYWKYDADEGSFKQKKYY